jgi:glucose-1-phosphate thymidylyltransferase
MKGIILAGGNGTRLFPMTSAFSKHLLPIYDKPMIYYPLSLMMLFGIKDICFICTAHDMQFYEALLGDGSRLGINIIYEIQDQPKGIPDAFLLSEKHFAGEKICLMLGDNVFYIPRYELFFEDCLNLDKGAVIFGYNVKDPERFGVAEVDENGFVLSIEEKPKNPKSNLAVPGLYFYDERVFDYAKKLQPSARGELEIGDINNIYLKNKELKLKTFGRSAIWLDCGTSDSLVESSNLIKQIETMQGIKIACLEEIAIKKGYSSKEEISSWLSLNKSKSSYIEYLRKICEYK